MKGTGSTKVLDVAYIPRFKRLVITCADGFITLYDHDWKYNKWNNPIMFMGMGK